MCLHAGPVTSVTPSARPVEFRCRGPLLVSVHWHGSDRAWSVPARPPPPPPWKQMLLKAKAKKKPKNEAVAPRRPPWRRPRPPSWLTRDQGLMQEIMDAEWDNQASTLWDHDWIFDGLGPPGTPSGKGTPTADDEPSRPAATPAPPQQEPPLTPRPPPGPPPVPPPPVPEAAAEGPPRKRPKGKRTTIGLRCEMPGCPHERELSTCRWCVGHCCDGADGDVLDTLEVLVSGDPQRRIRCSGHFFRLEPARECRRCYMRPAAAACTKPGGPLCKTCCCFATKPDVPSPCPRHTADGVQEVAQRLGPGMRNRGGLATRIAKLEAAASTACTSCAHKLSRRLNLMADAPFKGEWES